ncbi:MAG: FAD-dependent oxidoreductase [Planctomycetota bacterium]|nr:MAG: FAD-dependent oxidoreductase [Planctomycetota bacterium]
MRSVELAGGGRIAAERYVLAAGAWASQLASAFGEPIRIRPIRGQIVLLRTDGAVLNRIIQVGRRYLVPRPDGLVLVGSTEEDVGFAKQTTAAAVRELIDFAIRLVPRLRDAEVVRTWAGLRPAAERGLPYLGPMPGIDNLFVAAGHFRSGLQNSPGTAVLVREMVLEQPLSLACDAFAVVTDRSHV